MFYWDSEDQYNKGLSKEGMGKPYEVKGATVRGSKTPGEKDTYNIEIWLAISEEEKKDGKVKPDRYRFKCSPLEGGEKQYEAWLKALKHASGEGVHAK